MELNSMMGQQLAALRQTVSLSVMNMAQTTGAAQATVMLNDFSKAQETAKSAPHPTLGKIVDLRG
ncbi:polyribonucleotide nucleotidyltransferase [Brevibacillus sp. SYSU BS000544]|uniref:polyribonucleotide nucleotidyltransferase n=1 Tax=Brevibacillus sp. SYSU BS000544 TaxID=3416443 RepID=UPI003CE4C36C